MKFGRQPEGLYGDWKNRSIEPVEWEIRYDCFPICVAGIVLNFGIVWLTFSSQKVTFSWYSIILPHVLSAKSWRFKFPQYMWEQAYPLISGNYKYFVANLAICDIGLSSSGLFYGGYTAFVFHTGRKLTALSCTLLYGPIFAFSFSMVIACNMIIINRYLVIVKDREQFFTPKVIFLACLLCYSPLLSLFINLAFGRYITDHPGPCKVIFIPSLPLPDLFAIPIGLVYCTGFYCSYKIYTKLYWHYAQMGSGFKAERTRRAVNSETVNERSILRAIVVQAVVPILMLLPAMTLLVLTLKNKHYGVNMDSNWVLYESSTIRFDVRTMGDSLAMANPITDALVSVCVMRQYRRAAKDAFRSIRSRFLKSSSAETTVVHLQAPQSFVSMWQLRHPRPISNNT